MHRTFYSNLLEQLHSLEEELSNRIFLLSSPLSLQLFIFYIRNVADRVEAPRIKMSVC